MQERNCHRNRKLSHYLPVNQEETLIFGIQEITPSKPAQTPKSMRAIIVDDEKQSHDALTHLLQPLKSDVEILAHGYSVKEGLDLTAVHKPDLVFLDVEMPDGTGFDLLEILGKPAFYVVFITAYNKYAEAAFRFGALDFLTKPIQSDLFAETMERAMQRFQEKFTIEQLQIALETFYSAKEKKLPERIAISTSSL